jgi:hypothetical protein
MALNTVHAIARCGLAFVFSYHGLVPKLLAHHADEIAMLRDAGIPVERATSGVLIFGIAEVAFAFCLLLFWHHRWPLIVSIAAMCLGLAGVAINSPRFLYAAFNPVSLNVLVICLAAIDLVTCTPLHAAPKLPASQPRE